MPNALPNHPIADNPVREARERLARHLAELHRLHLDTSKNLSPFW